MIRTAEQLKVLETHGYWIFSASVVMVAFLLNRLRQKNAPPEEDERNGAHQGAMLWILFGIIIPFLLACHTWPPHNLAAAVDPLDHQEEGVRTAAANQALHGKRPYRDIYLLYGIGNEILEPIGVFHLFGKRLSSMRRWACVQEIAGPLALYALGLALLQTRGALLVLALLAVTRNPFWVSFRAAWALVALAIIMVALRRRNKRTWILAGIACAMAFLYSKESGAIPALSVGALLLYQWLRERGRDSVSSFVPFAVGWGIILLPFLLWLAATGGIPFLAHDLLHPAEGYLSAWAKTAPALAAPLQRFLGDPLLFYRPEGAGLRWWFPALLYALTAAWFFQRPGTWRNQQLRTLTLFCWLYFWVALGRSDFEHWLKGTPGYWLLLIVVGEQLWLWRPKAPWSGGKVAHLVVSLCVVMALLPVAFEGAGLLTSTPEHLRMWRAAWYYPDLPVHPSLARLGPRRLAPGEMERWAGVVDRIHRWAAPGDYAYVYGDYPTLYFLSDVINPTRYADLNYVISPRMEEEVIADLQRHPPRVILGEWIEGRLFIPAYGQAIARYIQTHFQAAYVFGGFVFYRPAGSAAAPAPS